ncbi:MAG: type II secretion system F family protein [Candidatus Micrarchaeia archaeon]
MSFLESLSTRYRLLRRYYAASGFKYSFELFALGFVLIALTVALALNALKVGPAVSVVAFAAVSSLIIALPISSRNARIAEIEKNLPDALKHMSLVLKAGGTVEGALQEAAGGDYGPLSAEFARALRQLKEGKSFEEVLVGAARDSGSLLFVRTATIIVDAKRAGAGMAGVIAEIAEDARDVLRIKRERYSRTTMHVLFLGVSAILLSPFIFGFTITIVNYISVGITSAMPGSKSGVALCDLNLLLTVFIAVESVISAFAIGIIREGKIAKYILYAPFMILFALIVFELGKYASSLIVGGAPMVC